MRDGQGWISPNAQRSPLASNAKGPQAGESGAIRTGVCGSPRRGQGFFRRRQGAACAMPDLAWRPVKISFLVIH